MDRAACTLAAAETPSGRLAAMDTVVEAARELGDALNDLRTTTTDPQLPHRRTRLGIILHERDALFAQLRRVREASSCPEGKDPAEHIRDLLVKRQQQG
jgi:hypothetical protein